MYERQVIRLGIPNGSLKDATLSVFLTAGLQFTGPPRSLWLSSGDPEIIPVLLRPQEIPVYVGNGLLDAGIAGLDWIAERDCLGEVELLADLQYAKQTARPVRWVLAVPDMLAIKTLEELRVMCSERLARGEPKFTITTELARISQEWLAENGIDARVEFSWGATEAKAGYFADAIIEATETGTSLTANGLRAVADVFRSTTQLFAHKGVYLADRWKREKLDSLAYLLNGALRAKDLVQLTVIADCELGLGDILPPDAELVTTEKLADGSTFRMTVTLRKSSVPQMLPAVAARGASHAWVSPVEVYYRAGSPGSGLPPQSLATT